VVVVGLTGTATPLVTLVLPGVITPVPPEKTAVRLALAPGLIVDGLAVKLLMVATGGGMLFMLEEPPQPASADKPRRKATANVAG
jgi:hypothetical protein